MKNRSFLLIFAVGLALGVAVVLMLRGARTIAPPVAPIEIEPVVVESLEPPPMIHEPAAAEPAKPPAAPSKPEAPEKVVRERRSSPDRMTGVKSWLEKLKISHSFDAELLAAEPCFSIGDVEWIQARWEEFDEGRRDLLERVNAGETSEGEQKWAALNKTLYGEIGDTGYNGYLYATGQSNGVQVGNLARGSRADEAGLKDGDRVIRYNGVRVHVPEELGALVGAEYFQDYVDVEVQRFDGKIETARIEPGPMGVIYRRWEVSPCLEDGVRERETGGRKGVRGPRGRRESTSDGDE